MTRSGATVIECRRFRFRDPKLYIVTSFGFINESSGYLLWLIFMLPTFSLGMTPDFDF